MLNVDVFNSIGLAGTAFYRENYILSAANKLKLLLQGMCQANKQ